MIKNNRFLRAMFKFFRLIVVFSIIALLSESLHTFLGMNDFSAGMICGGFWILYISWEYKGYPKSQDK